MFFKCEFVYLSSNKTLVMSDIVVTNPIASPLQFELFSPFEFKREIRIDNVFSQSMCSIDEQFGSDAALLKSLVLFFHNEVQNNVYGIGFFDVRRFANMMGYSISSLEHKHPNPAQLSGKSVEERARMYELEKNSPEKNKIWDSNLENALFILASRSVVLSYDQPIEDSNGSSEYLSTGLSSQRYLKGVQMIFKSESKNSTVVKKIYLYELESDFIDKTLRLYQYIDISMAPYLQRKNLENIFFLLSNRVSYMLYIMSEKGVKKSDGFYDDTYSIYFSRAKRLFNCNSSVERENKRKIDRKMKELVSLLSNYSNFKISFTWEKETPNSSYSYLLVIKISISMMFIKSGEEKALNKERALNELCCIELYHSVFKDIYSDYYYQGTVISKAESYVNWLNDDEKDFDKKTQAILKCHNKIYPNHNFIVLGYDTKPDTMCRILNSLKQINSTINSFKNITKMISNV